MSHADIAWKDGNGNVIAVITQSPHGHAELLQQSVDQAGLPRRPYHPPFKTGFRAMDVDHLPEDADPDVEVIAPTQKGHPGAFGTVRRNHIHEGIDLYCSNDEPVFAMTDGTVTSIITHFTGPEAGSPWWNQTSAIVIEDIAGVWIYGEIVVTAAVCVGDTVKAGDHIGNVVPVLKVDKGRPMSMLHLERYTLGTIDSVGVWELDSSQPPNLVDPTPELVAGLLL